MISINGLTRRTRLLFASLFILSSVAFFSHRLQMFTSPLPVEGAHFRHGWSWSTKLERHEQRYYCRKWDPLLPEGEDHPRCLRAKQYRQVGRVYDREIKGDHPHWHFAVSHNLRTLQDAQRCFLPQHHANYTSCPDKPIIVSGYWWTAAIAYNETAGETIWQRSLVDELAKLGFFVTFQGPYENWSRVWEMMPDAIRFLWASEIDAISCMGDPRCILPAHYSPDGEDLSVDVSDDELGMVPIDKLMITDYWGSRPNTISVNEHYWRMGDGEWSYSPLGQRWTVTPWKLPGHTFLPYSLEGNCPENVPWHQRNESALMLAKRSSYFDLHWVTKRGNWSALANETDFDLLSTVKEEDGHPLPYGLMSLGGMSRKDYETLVGGVKAMVGIGMPTISPSVYQALCQGVPVVIPKYKEMEELNGWGAFGGWSQHGPAALIGPPYVYSYNATNYDSLNQTVHAAIRTPIEPFVPVEMRRESVIAHLIDYLTTDWHGLFMEILAQNGRYVPKQHPRILERCHELKRCFKIQPGNKRYRQPEFGPRDPTGPVLIEQH